MKASVLITTYNQELIIGQAIESALSQVTDFDYEIVIGEDCSTDRLRIPSSIPRSGSPAAARAEPRHHENFADAFLQCHGQYVACLDGDDYWSSPHKLQRQVDFLDTHPDYSICFHNALMVWEDGSQAPVLHFPPGHRSTYWVGELFHHDFISTASVGMVRNGLVRESPSWYQTLPVPDWPFFVLHAVHGKIGYLNEDWTAYRQHPAGIYSRLPPEKRMEQNIGIVRTFREVRPSEWRPILNDAIHSRCLSLALYHHRQGDRSRADEFARMAIREAHAGPLGSRRLAAKVFAYMCIPALASLVSRWRDARRIRTPRGLVRGSHALSENPRRGTRQSSLTSLCDNHAKNGGGSISCG